MIRVFCLLLLLLILPTDIWAEYPLQDLSVSGGKSQLQFNIQTTRPGLLRLRVVAGSKRLTAMYHFAPGKSSHAISLAGIGGEKLPGGAIMFEAEFRFRKYHFERYVGGTGKSQGRFISPAALEKGSQGRLYVVDQGNDRIQVFDRDYRYLFEFGGFAWNTANSKNEVQEGSFDEPSDICEGANKELFVTDRGNNRLVRIDLQGRYLGEFGKGDLRLPRGVAADHLHHIIVCDTDNDRVLRFDTAGNLSAELGSFGRGRRQFNQPSAAAFDPTGNLYVVDGGNSRIQVYDHSLRPSFDIRLDGVKPVNVHIDDEYFLYIVDEAASRVLILNNSFQAIHQLPAPGDAFGLRQPVDVTVTADGRLHILDQAKNTIALIRVEQEMLVRRGKIRVATHR